MQEISNEEKDPFIIQNKIIFKKYRPIKQIGKGTFSKVYIAINTKNNSYVAIKVEKRDQKGVELLESEAFLLYSLKGFGIPSVLSYGRTKSYNILVLPLLGKSLLDLFILRNKTININDICLIAIQILERIEWIHSNNIVYRDIKPENFLFGRKDPEVLYLIDFGLCRKFKSSNTGKHISPKNLGKFTGTSRYASVYAMAGNEQSRRDDIESIGYMIIFLMKKRLPWQGIKGNSYKECYHKLYLMKKYIEIEDLCKGLPKEIVDYMINAKSLKFEQEPNYNYLKNLFYEILKKNKFNLDKKIFSWIVKVNNNNLILGKANSVGRTPNGKIKRKSSPQNRLYNKIKNSMENKKKIVSNSQNPKLDKKTDKTDYISFNTEHKNIKSQPFNEDKSIKSKTDLSYKNKIEDNSETMKVMINKNINSGFNEKIGHFPRINSENKIINVKKFQIMSDEDKKKSKKKYSPENIRFNNIFYINQHNLSGIKISDDENSKNISNKNNNISDLKKTKFINNNFNNNSSTNINYPGKIIKISPIRNNYNTNIHINKGNNKYYRINQIKVVNTNNIESINNSNSFSNKKQNTTDNITYNTYNTYNTFNSFNDTLDKTSTNNNNSNNNIPKSENIEANNNQINKRISHITYQKNNNNKINYNYKNFKSNKNMNNNICFINKGSFINNNPNKLIYFNKIDNQREVNSVNIRKKHIKENITTKKKSNILLTKFNNRTSNSEKKIGGINTRPVFSPSGNIIKNNNKKMNYIKKNQPQGMRNIKNLNNNKIIATNMNLRANNSYNNIIRNNNNIKQSINHYFRIKNNSDDNVMKKEINNNINNINIRNQNQNQNNLKRIFIINNKKNINNKNENNNFIRLDKMKNNLNEDYFYNQNMIDSSNKINKDIFPNYNTYKINSLKILQNNNNFLLLKRVFPSFKYKTENDSNSALIHSNNYNNNNLININNRIINDSNSININSNKSNNTNNKNSNNDNKFSNENEKNPLFIEDHSEIIKNSNKNNIQMKKNEFGSETEYVERNNGSYKNYLNNKYKTEDIEINYLDGNNKNMSRINKYKMIRYKGN